MHAWYFGLRWDSLTSSTMCSSPCILGRVGQRSKPPRRDSAASHMYAPTAQLQASQNSFSAAASKNRPEDSMAQKIRCMACRTIATWELWPLACASAAAHASVANQLITRRLFQALAASSGYSTVECPTRALLKRRWLE